jgi:hypothetical protein
MVEAHFDWPNEAAEIQRAKNAVADATFAWGTLESSLATLLSAILQRTLQDAIASAIYFAPNNFETRFKIIDCVLRERLHKNKLEKPFIATWGEILNTLNRLKDTRNKIAHGSLIATYRGHASTLRRVVRLTSPIRDIQRHRKSEETGQLPGMAPADIEGHVTAVRAQIQRVDRFRDLMWSVDSNPDKALLAILGELKGRRQK